MSESVIKSGVLWKKGANGLLNNYKPRYFELCNNGILNYYEVSKGGERKHKGSIALQSVLGIERQSDDAKNTHKLLIFAQDRDWTLLCKNDAGGNHLLAQQERDAWAAALEQQIRSAAPDTADAMESSDQPPEIIAGTSTDSGLPLINPFYGGVIYAAAAEGASAPPSAPPMPEEDEKEAIPVPLSTSSALSSSPHTAEHVQFKLAEVLSLKSELFSAWVSFDIHQRRLRTTDSEPMLHERFTFRCLDDLNKVFTIQTSAGLYLSVTNHGDVEFVAAAVGVYQQWCVEYHHINSVAIKSCSTHQYFGVDNAGGFHCRYPSMTDIVKWTVSPPVRLTSAQQTHAIAVYHDTHPDATASIPPLNARAHTTIEWPQFPHGEVGTAFQICDAKACFLGVTDTAAKYVQGDLTNCQSFDGALLSRSSFHVAQWATSSSQLFTIKSALCKKYLSPPPSSSSGRMKLVAHATQRELFRVLWHDVNVVSLVSYHGTMLCVDAEHKLCHARSPTAASCFRIHCKTFDKLNRVNDPQKKYQLPRPQLPVRSISGQIKRDIFLKSQCAAAPNGGDAYLTLRSSPYRYEAISTIMAQWETIMFEMDKRTHLHACIVTLYTVNGLVIACSPSAQICFLTKDDENDELRCRWRVLFHHYAQISIQNEKYKGWMRLQKDKHTSMFTLCMSNPKSFDAHGRPVINVEDAMQPFTDAHCRFELTPPANCKDLMARQQQQNSVVAIASSSTDPVSFAM